MNKLSELIVYYNENGARPENILIKANLMLINELSENISDSMNKIYIDKIISSCMEIIDIQRNIIQKADNAKSQKEAIKANEMRDSDIPQVEQNNRADIDKARALNPYTPPMGGFCEDSQIREAFANYLKYHVVNKAGKPKGFADTTVYDYCSRIKVLWEICYRNFEKGKLESISFEKNVISGKTFLNAYNNIEILSAYIDSKKEELAKIETGKRQPFTQEELRDNLLNNARNLANTIAAFERFKEFKKNIENN